MSLPFDPRDVELVECMRKRDGNELMGVQVTFKNGGYESFGGADLTDEIRRFAAKCESIRNTTLKA